MINTPYQYHITHNYIIPISMSSLFLFIVLQTFFFFLLANLFLFFFFFYCFNYTCFSIVHKRQLTFIFNAIKFFEQTTCDNFFSWKIYSPYMIKNLKCSTDDEKKTHNYTIIVILKSKRYCNIIKRNHSKITTRKSIIYRKKYKSCYRKM